MDIATSTIANFLQWPVDWPLIGLLAALLSLESFSSGSTRTAALSLAVPISSLVMQWLPATAYVGALLQQANTPLAQAGIFFVLFVTFYFAIHHMIFSFGSAGGSVFNALIHGFAATAVLIIFWIQTPGLREFWQFGPQVQLIFGEAYRAWWIAGSFAALAYARG